MFLVTGNRLENLRELDELEGSWPPGKQIRFSSVTQSCRTVCDPMNRSMPGLPVHHQLPEFTQTHVHRVSDATQLSHPLSSPSPPALNLSQHQGLFKWVNIIQSQKHVKRATVTHLERRGSVFMHKSETQVSNLLNWHKTREGEHSNPTQVSPLVLKTSRGSKHRESFAG